MDEEDQVKEAPGDQETDRDRPETPEWALTMDADERPAEEAGYGYGV